MDHRSDPSEEEAQTLFNHLEALFPSTLDPNRWYLLAIAALTGSGQPNHASTLYTYLISKPEYSTSEQRHALIRRLREALVKCVAIIGVCRPLEAIMGVSAVEKPEDREYSCSRENWASGEENLARGTAWLDTIYKHNRAGTIALVDAHKDFAWISKNITYGLYLSDQTILDAIDTEIVVLTGIMVQNLPKETGWHLRGLRRVGVSMADTEVVQQCIEMVAKFARVRVDKVPRVADIEHEV